MFAIAITTATFDLIEDADILDEKDLAWLLTTVDKGRYFTRGYVDCSGRLHEWMMHSAKVFERTFEFDPVAIQTGWDQIVRKDADERLSSQVLQGP